MRQIVYDIPGMNPVTLAVGAELPLLDLFSAEYQEATIPETELHSGTIQRSDHNSFHIRIGETCRLPLFHFLFKEQLFVGRNLLSFLAVGADKIDPHYLVELEYFGFPTERKSLLKDVRMLFPGDEVVVKAKEFIWLGDAQPEQLGLQAFLIKPQEYTEALYNILPKVAVSLFSPIDHVFFAQILQQLLVDEEPVLEVSRGSLPSNLGRTHERTALFNKAHKSGVVEGINLKKYTRKIVDFLRGSWQASGSDQGIDDYLEEKFYFPYMKFQLNILAAGVGKKIKIIGLDNSNKDFSPSFTIDDTPIVNVYESFQRIFFYGNQWLARIWFFIPPMVSAKIIKQQQRHSKAEHHIFIYALTLDYLLRFYQLK